MRSLKKQSAVLALGLALTLGLAACGNNDESVGLEEGAAPAAPVAQIDALTGEQTAVTLDPASSRASPPCSSRPPPSAARRSRARRSRSRSPAAT